MSIDKDKLFVTGYHDGKGYLYVLDLAGKLLKKIEYGSEWDSDGYVGVRSTVMHDDGKLYVVSGLAELFCYDTQSLQLLWKKDYIKEYGAKNTAHGWNGRFWACSTNSSVMRANGSLEKMRREIGRAHV